MRGRRLSRSGWCCPSKFVRLGHGAVGADFRNHAHANVLAQAFGSAVAEVAIGAPVAARREPLRVVEAFFVEQGRLGEGRHVGARRAGGGMGPSLGEGVFLRRLAEPGGRDGDEAQGFPDEGIKLCGVGVCGGLAAGLAQERGALKEILEGRHGGPGGGFDGAGERSAGVDALRFEVDFGGNFVRIIRVTVSSCGGLPVSLLQSFCAGRTRKSNLEARSLAMMRALMDWPTLSPEAWRLAVMRRRSSGVAMSKGWFVSVSSWTW